MMIPCLLMTVPSVLMMASAIEKVGLCYFKGGIPSYQGGRGSLAFYHLTLSPFYFSNRGGSHE